MTARARPVTREYLPDTVTAALADALVRQATDDIGVAAVGSLYLALATPPSEVAAGHAFALTSLVLGAAALLAAATAYLTTHARLLDERG